MEGQAMQQILDKMHNAVSVWKVKHWFALVSFLFYLLCFGYLIGRMITLVSRVGHVLPEPSFPFGISYYFNLIVSPLSFLCLYAALGLICLLILRDRAPGKGLRRLLTVFSVICIFEWVASIVLLLASVLQIDETQVATASAIFNTNMILQAVGLLFLLYRPRAAVGPVLFGCYAVLSFASFVIKVVSAVHSYLTWPRYTNAPYSYLPYFPSAWDWVQNLIPVVISVLFAIAVWLHFCDLRRASSAKAAQDLESDAVQPTV